MTPPSASPLTVIVGAGISGLLLARALLARGEAVVVLEKSRGYGGRMATKRVGEVVFDQGAQFFTARDPAFVAEVEAWGRAGWATEWPGAAHRRLMGQPAMTAVPKGLAVGLDVRREHKVTAVRRSAGGAWTVSVEQQPAITATRVLLTCPVPQALGLLDAGEAGLPQEVRAELERLTYHPCLALLAVLSGTSAVPPEGLALNGEPVRWLADNVKKGVARGVPAAVTIHAAPVFSAMHYAASEAEVAAQLLPAVAGFLGAPVVSTALHRWKFSEPKATHAERCVWLGGHGLGFAGDAFGGPKVEGAALSGLALAAAVAGTSG